MGTAPWNSARHTDPKVDEDYARYAREMDPVKRKAMPRNLRSSVLKLCTGTQSGSTSRREPRGQAGACTVP
jgi:hypothetical protein